MKYCSNCGAQLNDDAVKCEACGTEVSSSAASQAETKQNVWDHTSEFDQEDIEKNKIFALLGYIFSVYGLIVTYLAAKDSPYAMFHAKQAIKITVAQTLLLLATTFLCWTCIVPVAAVVLACILAVVNIIAIFQVFLGYAKEPWLVRSLKFLGKI